jgi:hypothetical protein
LEIFSLRCSGNAGTGKDPNLFVAYSGITSERPIPRLLLVIDLPGISIKRGCAQNPRSIVYLYTVYGRVRPGFQSYQDIVAFTKSL